MEVLVIFLFLILIVLILVFRGSVLERLDRMEREILSLRQQAPAAPEKKETFKPPVPVTPVESPAPPPPPPPSPPRPERPGLFERHPDIEKFIGENLISKIGIAVLVLAIGFFVKYAIDNDWIGPVGRVGVGVLCGGILIGLAHWLRKSYAAFSSVLVGGGLAVLYFTIALAFHQYRLFGQTAAFVIMLVITLFAVLLSLLYDRQELAVISLMGGFVTPFLVSNGNGNYAVLFTYLLILNTGLLVIAYNKAWRLLNILAFGFTVILFASWLLGLPYDAPAATYRGGLGFATAFYLLFFIINIAHTVRANKKFIASDFGILLVNTCLYAGATLYILAQLGLDRYKGLFCAIMGIFHLAASWLLFRKNRVDKNILYLFIGVTMSFVSLTAPLQLHGHYITLFWASEAVLLYWLFLKSQIGLIRLAALLVWGAMVVSLYMDWVKIYWPHDPFPIQLPVIFNKGYLTGLYAAICCGVLFRLIREGWWSKLMLIACGVLLFIGGELEIIHQFGHHFSDDVAGLYVLFYAWILIVLFVFYTDRIKANGYKLLNTGLMAGTPILYLLALIPVFAIQKGLLEGNEYLSHFIVHWMTAVLAMVVLYRLIVASRRGQLNLPSSLFSWSVGIILVIFLSAEGQLLVNMLFYSPKNSLEELQRVYGKTGLPILWGLCSFAFMWLGMRHKFKPLRIISLALFSVTLLKLFLFDIRNIPIAGKIAAFFCLGVLLLVVSFMYQRLKKIIIADEKKTE
jgi:uncharacterized membrane protein